jgi:GDP-mannose transporter
VVSGAHFSMTFLLLCMQSIVCVFCVSIVKRLGIISFSSFRWKDARAWFPISFLLVTVIYTGSKSLVSKIHKNCKLILILCSSTAALKHSPVHNI